MTRKEESSDRIPKSKKSALTRLAEKQEIVDHRKKQVYESEKRREAKNRDIDSLSKCYYGYASDYDVIIRLKDFCD